MANTNLRFFRGTTPESPAQGDILFATQESSIKVYNGTAWEVYGGKVLDASYDSATNKLTITKPDGITEVDLHVYLAGNGITIDNDTDKISADMEYITDNMVIGQDLTVTQATGAYASGAKITAGTSLQEILKKILQEVKQPKIEAQPKVTVTLTNAGAKEVGTEFTPSYSVTFVDGKYTYSPTAAGCTATGYSVSDTNKSSADTATGTFTKFTVGDDTNYKVSATATYSEGNTAKDNTGANSSPEVKVAAGTTASASSAAVTGFRSFFYGTNTTPVDSFDSAAVRSLSNANAQATSGKKFNINIPAGAKQVVIAVPAARSLKSVIDVNLSRAEVKTAFSSSTVDVEGLNGYAAASYNVFVYTSLVALDANTYEVTLA